MKKVLSIVLALVMMLSAVSMLAVAKDDCDCTMAIGETRTVSLPGAVYDDFVIVKLVAAGSGKVVITSNGKSSLTCNPVLEVYKNSLSSANFLGKAENNGAYHNFKYELNCEAGTTYFLAMHNSLSATSWEVSIKCLHETYVDGYCVTCLGACPHEIADNIVGCCPCGENFNGLDIAVDEEVQLASSSNYAWFRFTPAETAPYILKSENPDDEETWLKKVADPAFIIVDETGEIVLANDANVSADNKNFNFPFLFEKGERYFIGVKDNERNADDWYFTLANGKKHTIEVEKEVQKEVLDAEGNPVLDAEGNPTYETVIETEYVEHGLAYNAQVNPTCQAVGHTPSIVCETCKDEAGNALVIAGGDEIAKVACKDDNANYKCDWCGAKVGEEPEPEDPTKDCSCNCHKDGISKFFFDFALFFQKIFRLNSVCKCGVRHY